MDQRTRLAFGRCELDPAARVLRRDGRQVDLQPKVLDLLVFLIDHRDRVVSRDELLDALWPGVAVTPAALSRAIHKAREAVGDDGAAQGVIQTSHGHGFRFVAELGEAPAPGGEAFPASSPIASSPVASSPIAADRAAEGRSGRHRARAAAGLAAAVVALVWLGGSRGSRDRATSRDLPRATAIAALPFSDIRAHGDQQELAGVAVTVDVTWSAQLKNRGFDIFTQQPILDDHPPGEGTVSGSLGSYDVTTAGGTTLIVPLLSPLTGPPAPTALQLLFATTSGFASGFPNYYSWPLLFYGAPFTLHNPFAFDFGDIGEFHITVPVDVFDEASYAGDLVGTRLLVPQKLSQMRPGCSTSYPAAYCQVRILDAWPFDVRDGALVEYRTEDDVTHGQSFGQIEYRFTVRRVCGDGGVGDSEECNDESGPSGAR